MNNKVSNRIIAFDISENASNTEEVVPPLWLSKYQSNMKNQIPSFMHLCVLGVMQTVAA